MRALQIDRPGEIREIEVSIPQIEDDEALVRVAYSGLCATDLSIFDGDMTLVREGLIRYPVRFGHEWSGVICRVGKAVKNFSVGDRVISDPGVSCGKCRECRQGNYSRCAHVKSVGTINCWDGSFAQYMKMPVRHLFRLPQNVSLLQGALIEPAGIALAGIRKAGVCFGSTVVVSGTGAIGMIAVALSKGMGAKKVILSGRTPEKLEIGRRLGADVVVNVCKEDLFERCLRETGGKGADSVLETSGNVEAVHACLAAAAVKGTVALIGFYERDVERFPVDTISMHQLNVCGVMGEFGIAGEVIDILARTGLDFTPVITHIISFDEAVKTIRNIDSLGSSRIKVMVKIDDQI